MCSISGQLTPLDAEGVVVAGLKAIHPARSPLCAGASGRCSYEFNFIEDTG